MDPGKRDAQYLTASMRPQYNDGTLQHMANGMLRELETRHAQVEEAGGKAHLPFKDAKAAQLVAKGWSELCLYFVDKVVEGRTTETTVVKDIVTAWEKMLHATFFSTSRTLSVWEVVSPLGTPE